MSMQTHDSLQPSPRSAIFKLVSLYAYLTHDSLQPSPRSALVQIGQFVCKFDVLLLLQAINDLERLQRHTSVEQQAALVHLGGLQDQLDALLVQQG